MFERTSEKLRLTRALCPFTPSVPLRPENQTYDVVEKVHSEGSAFSEASSG